MQYITESVIGIDIGGVLVSHEKDWDGAQKWHRTSDSIVPGALGGLSKLIFFLGASKVFLISFAKEHGSNGGMRKKIKDWLHKEICICAKTGLLKKQHHLHGSQDRQPWQRPHCCEAWNHTLHR